MAVTTTKSKDQIASVKAQIGLIARSMSSEPLGLAYHLPEEWAEPSRCFENVMRKVRQDGGRMRFGWTFHHCFVQSMPDQGYLFLTHHAVWNAPDGRLVNVTPYPDQKHYPLPKPGADILFLVDGTALPVTNKNLVAPLPMRFFPVGDDERLVAYVERLNQEEREECQKIYGGITDLR
jgi:hypothetical protein